MSTGLPSGRLYPALAVGFIAFAMYASLLPFDLQWVPVASAWEQLRGALLVPPSRISRSDVLANTLLFIPIGFALAGSVLVNLRSWPAYTLAVVAIVLFSGAVSLVTEYLQIYARERVVSGVDIAAQLAGCAIGIAVWAVAGDAFTRWLRVAAESGRGDRPSHLLGGYVAAWLFVSLAPFDISLDVGDLGDRLRTGKIAIIPFAPGDATATERTWDALAETLSAVPVGAFGVVAFARYRRVGLTAFSLGASLVMFVEIAHVFIRSHAASSTDVIFGCVGVALGVWISGRVLPGRLPRPVDVDNISSWAVAAVAAASAIAIFYHWQPFDFAVDEDVIRRKLARISLLPFAGYASGSYLNALNDLLTKISLSVPVGIGASFIYPPHAARGVFALACVAAATLLFALIEGGQLFLAARVPDPTDVLVGVAGVYAGLSLGRWLQGGSRNK